MITESMDFLKNIQNTRFCSGSNMLLISKFEAEFGFSLPINHLVTLSISNGFEVFSGFIRMFGLYSEESIDSVGWNYPQCWKFAWGDRCTDFWCFAETAWGDQYAYSISSLMKKRGSDVFILDALSMTARFIFPSFTEFFCDEFLRQAENPYDQTIIQASKKFGVLHPKLHLVYNSSIFLGGSKDISYIQTMNSRAAMICNGDIAIQLDGAEAGSIVASVQSYEDESKRMRLRLSWA